jgi:hypothetical protein
MCAPAWTLLVDLGDQAVRAGGRGLWAAFVSGALRERCPVSVGRVRRDASLWPGLDVRSYPALGGGGSGLICAPCVIFGFWVQLRIGCVDLLCAVSVRLLKVLFTACGPFLPSLSVRICRYSYRDEGRGK